MFIRLDCGKFNCDRKCELRVLNCASVDCPWASSWTRVNSRWQKHGNKRRFMYHFLWSSIIQQVCCYHTTFQLTFWLLDLPEYFVGCLLIANISLNIDHGTVRVWQTTEVKRSMDSWLRSPLTIYITQYARRWRKVYGLRGTVKFAGLITLWVTSDCGIRIYRLCPCYEKSNAVYVWLEEFFCPVCRCKGLNRALSQSYVICSCRYTRSSHAPYGDAVAATHVLVTIKVETDISSCEDTQQAALAPIQHECCP